MLVKICVCAWIIDFHGHTHGYNVVALIDVHDDTVLWTQKCPIPEINHTNLQFIVRVQNLDVSYQVQKTKQLYISCGNLNIF